MNNKEPSIGYSIAYPFGVIGPILCIYFLTRTVQPTFPSKVPKFHMGEVTLGASYAGRKLDELDLPSGVQVTMVRQKDQNVIPKQDVILNAGDGLMIVADEHAPSPRRPNGWKRSTRVALPGTVPRSMTSGFSSARPTSSASRWRSSPCRAAFPSRCLMFAATTWTSYRRRI